MSLEHVSTDVDYFAVQETDKVFATDIEDLMARGVMLVNLNATSSEQLWNIIVTKECLSYF